MIEQRDRATTSNISAGNRDRSKPGKSQCSRRSGSSIHLSVMEATQNRFYFDAYKTLENTFAGYVNLILALGPLRSMLHFHDGLIHAIERSDPDGAVKAVEENFRETDVRLQLLLQSN